jgi:hypothetical protein
LAFFLNLRNKSLKPASSQAVPKQKDAKKCDTFPVTRCGDSAGKVDASDSNLKNEKAKLQEISIDVEKKNLT